MSKIRIPIYIIGAIILCLASSLITYFSLAGVGIIEAEKIELVYELTNDRKVYDSKSFTLSDSNVTLKEGSLLEGHYAKYYFEGSITNVGTEEVSLTVKIFDEQGHDVTNSYLISSNTATVTVEPKKVEIEIDASEEIVYNGEKLVYDSFEVTYGSLATGHSFEPKIKASVSVPDQTITTNDVVPYIFDKSGNDVTKNYDIELKIGDTKIVKRSIVVKPCDEEFTYDGTEKTADEIEFVAGELVDGHKVKYSIYGKSIYAGEIQTRIESIYIYDEFGKDVTNYYTIDSSSYGKLKINKRDLIIQAGSSSKVYDGTELKCSDYTFDGLVNGDVISNVKFATTSSIVNAGVIKNEILSCKIENDSIDVAENYNIVYQAGSLSIIKADLELTARSFFKTYDGQPLTAEEENPILTNSDLLKCVGLINEEVIYFNYKGSIINAGTEANAIVNVSIYSNDNNVTNNYNIIIVDGELTVKPKYLLIDGKSASKEYDGMPLNLENDGSVLSCSGLVGDLSTEDIIVTYTSSIKDIDKVTNYFFVNSIGNDLLTNYDIEYNFGTLEITKKKVTITGLSDSKVYDGQPLTLNDIHSTVDDAGLTRYFISVNYNASITNVGKIENTIEKYVIKNNEGYEVTNNFDVTIINGTLEVTKKEVTIIGLSDSKIYDGQPLVTENALLDNGGLDNYTISFVYDASITNVGKIENTIENLVIKDLSGIDVTNNFDITIINGTLEVTKKEVTIKGLSDSKIYDGQPLTLNSNHGVADNGGLDDFFISVDYNASITKVGEIDNVIENIVIKNSDRNEVTENFNITIENGKLTVTKATITIKAKSFEKVYDGNVLSYEGTNLTQYDLEYYIGIASGDVLSIKYTGSQKNCGETTNAVEVLDIKRNGESVKDCYDLDSSLILYGTLKVIKADLKLVTISEDFGQYDGLEHSVTGNQFASVIGLAETDTISVQYNTKIKMAGSVLNTVSLADITIQNDTENVINNYNISFEFGTLTVSKADLKLVTLSEDFGQYDGNVYKILDTNFDSNEGLAETDTISVNYKTEIVMAGSVSNTVSVDDITILNNGVNSINNYNITFEFGVLTISKANLELEAKSSTKKYDGKALTYEGSICTIADLKVCTGLASGETIEFVYTGSVTNFGTADNIINLNSIRISGYNYSSVNNYNIEITKGTLEIEKATLNLVASSFEYDYTGNAINLNNYTEASLLSYTGLGDSKLIYNIKPTSVTDILLAGTYNYSIEIASLTDEYGNDVSANYDVYSTEGTIKINKVNLVLETISAEFTYDSTTHIVNNDTKLKNITGLKDTDTVSFSYNGSITYVGTASNTINNVEIKNGGIDVTNCYLITIINGTLRVNKAELVLKSKNESKVYDGTALTCSLTDVIYCYDTSLGVNDALTFTYKGSITKVGTVDNVIDDVIIKNGETDVTNCYSITLLPGTLEITKASVSLAFTNERIYATYTGNAVVLPNSYLKLMNGSESVTGYNLIAEEYTKVYNSYTRDIQVYRISVLTASGEDVTDCFDIDYSSTIRVIFSPRSLVLNIKDINVNAGEKLTIAEIVEISNLTPLVAGDYIDTTIEIEFTASMTYDDLVDELIYNGIIIYNSDDVTSEYEITCVGGSLTIN